MAGIDAAWTDYYISSAYHQGIARARQEMRKAGYPVPGGEEMGTAVDVAFNQPFHADRVGVLYTRTFEDLKSVTQVMNSQIRI